MRNRLTVTSVLVLVSALFGGCSSEPPEDGADSREVVATSPAPAEAASVGEEELQEVGEKSLKEQPPALPPDWLPIYSEVEREYQFDSDGVNFLTKDAPSDVIAFYYKSLEKAGFSFDIEPVAEQNMGRLQAHRGDDDARIKVEVAAIRSSPASSTQVLVIW